MSLRAAFTTRASLAQYMGFVKTHLHKAREFATEVMRAEGGAGGAVGEGECEGRVKDEGDGEQEGGGEGGVGVRQPG